MSEPSQLLMQGVVGRDDAGPKGAPRGRLHALSLSLGPSSVALLGLPEDGTLAFVDLVSGRRAPDQGVVAVGGESPFLSDRCRRKIGALGIEPRLPEVGRVSELLRLACNGLSPAGDSLASGLLASFGLASWATRRVRSLSRGELRAIEFMLAVSIPEPALVVLTEPFQDVAGVAESDVVAAIERLSARCPVIVVTASPRDARRLPRALILHRGAVVRETAGDHAQLAGRALAQMVVWLARGARRMTAALTADRAVDGAVLEVSSGELDAGLVRVNGKDVEALSLAISKAAATEDVVVTGLSEMAPQMFDVQAASEWELRSRMMAMSMMRPTQGFPFGGAPFGGAPFGGAPVGQAAPGFVVAPRPAQPTVPTSTPAPAPPPAVAAPPSPPAEEPAPPAPAETPPEGGQSGGSS
jgi:ABC-2 type transport system ATP-binding protein